MEGMLNDLAVGVDHQKEFSQHVQEKSIALGRMSHGDFTVKVLTTGYWPSYNTFDVRLPDEMLRCTQVRGAAGVSPKTRAW